MTLRLRLVLAIVVLVTIALGIFGFATYSLYARSLYGRLDDQIRTATPFVSRRLAELAGLETRPPGVPGRSTTQRPGPGPGPGPAPPTVVPPDAFGELVGTDGTVLSSIQLAGSDSQPDLPEALPADPEGTFATVGSRSGTGEWRVLSTAADQAGAAAVVLAVPLTEVHTSLEHLLLVEVVAGICLVLIAAAGSWVILSRGLRPLEHMATSARSISAGDLSGRVTPAGDGTEVGELGLALNTMLGGIEQAFRERDATEQKLRQFLSDAAHELRTPLTSIQGFAELSRMGADAAPVDPALAARRIEEETARMKTLVDDLTLLARLDETKAVDHVPLDLAVLAADACSDAVAVDPARAVTLVAPEPVVVEGDRDHLRQAIANLMTNALKHTPAGTPVVVGARRDSGGWATLTVRDHGPGIPPDARARVFDRFWQADAARTGTGSGLGLSIVAAIASEHAGTISVDDPEDGAGGTVFSLRLPAVPTPAAADGSDARPST